MVAIIRYHGGKVKMAKKIISFAPPHVTYVEPFAGGAAVLLAKPRSKLEVYNDLDGEVVALFKTIRDYPTDLCRAIRYTPFAREEHEASYQRSDNAIEQARRTLVKSHFGFGSSGIYRKTGFRGRGTKAGTLPVHTWCNVPAAVNRTAERLFGVVIENRPALDVIKDYDTPETFFYLDPPYLPETRDKGTDYAHEMSLDDHENLLAMLRCIKGKVILSGYSSALYDTALHNWRQIKMPALADGARKRTEVLWLNF